MPATAVCPPVPDLVALGGRAEVWETPVSRPESIAPNPACPPKSYLSPSVAPRVLQVVNGEHYAGAERVQDLLAEQFDRLGLWNGLVCVKPNKFPEQRLARQVPLWSFPMRGKIDLRPAHKLARLIRAQQVQLLHAHGARGALIASLAGWWTNTPVVYHVHGQTGVEVGGKWSTWLNATLERRILQSCAGLIAVSDSTARYLTEHGAPAHKIHVIPNGVPGRPLRQLVEASHSFASQSHNGPTLGFVAWLRPRKGLEVFLDAAAQLLPRFPALRLWVVGSFETSAYEAEIKTRAAHLGLSDHIVWRGFCQPIDAELDMLDVLAFPSVLAEGMPMVLLEALAAGVPIVASRVPGVTDVIRHEQNGLLVEPQSAAELAGAIEKLLDSSQLRARMIQAGQQCHAAEFSDVVMARRTQQLYAHVLATQAPSARHSLSKGLALGP
ncbi:MAG: glycosyltransferase family 4 protein [Pirellulales bacterium]|nr:glycosyltransferase family 4 protein [Pirellulales bacterium]